MKRIKSIVLFLFIAFLALVVYYFFPPEKLPSTTKIDNLIVYKSERKMEAYSNGKIIKTYTISLGKQPIGTKEFEGDNKTPEGIYYINDKNPNSVCYKNLGISYPNEEDRAVAKKLGKPTGGDIKIHGMLNSKGWVGKFHRWVDWTNGCVAVTNSEMEELYNFVPIGTKIEIKP